MQGGHGGHGGSGPHGDSSPRVAVFASRGSYTLPGTASVRAMSNKTVNRAPARKPQGGGAGARSAPRFIQGTLPTAIRQGL